MHEQPDVSTAFIDASRRYLTGQYVPKIGRCLEQLDDDQVWWRPNEHSNSVANLVLHLIGNVRQYVISGVGGRPDVRERAREFDARRRASGAELLAELRSTIEEVDRVLRDLDLALLPEVRSIQGRPMTVFDAIFHAVEHFSTHVGQIIYITKQLTDRDLGFYGFEDETVQQRW